MSAFTDPRSFQGLSEIHGIAKEGSGLDIAAIIARSIIDSRSEEELLDLAHVTAEREGWSTRDFCLGDLEDGEIILYLEESMERMVRYLAGDSLSLNGLRGFIDKAPSEVVTQVRRKVTLDYCLQQVTPERKCLPSEMMALERTLPGLNEVPEYVFSAN